MKDEIKEKIKAYYIGNDIDKVLDCITNLQNGFKSTVEELCETTEKLEKLQEENENKDSKILELQQELLNKKLNIKDIEYKEKMIYKSRNEKAIEYNKQKLEDIKEEIITVTIYDKKYEKYVKEILDNNLNILKGDKDE